MRKITFIVPALSAGGAERVMSELANHLAELGDEVTVVSFSGDEVDDFYETAPQVLRLKLGVEKKTRNLLHKIWFNLVRFYAIRSAVKSLYPDVVISFMVGTNITTLIALFGIGIKTIVSERNDPSVWPRRRSLRVLRKAFYRSAAATVVQTRAAYEWFCENCATREMRVIHNPVREFAQPDRAREKTVLAVGRMVDQKGFDVLIEAFSYFLERVPGWSLTILGEGPERQSLEEQVRELGVHSAVNMPGAVKNVEAYYATAGMFVLSSRFEGFPNALLEAMKMGCPVIAADCPSGPNEIIRDSCNGFLVEVENVAQLAERMSLLAGSEGLRDEAGRKATKTAEKFSIEAIGAEWSEVIDSLKNGASGVEG